MTLVVLRSPDARPKKTRDNRPGGYVKRTNRKCEEKRKLQFSIELAKLGGKNEVSWRKYG